MMIDWTKPICAVNKVTGKRYDVVLDPDEPQPDREGDYCLDPAGFNITGRCYFREDVSGYRRTDWRIENREPVEPARPDLTKATDEGLEQKSTAARKGEDPWSTTAAQTFSLQHGLAEKLKAVGEASLTSCQFGSAKADLADFVISNSASILKELAAEQAPPEPDYEAMRPIVQKYYDASGVNVKCAIPMNDMDRAIARTMLAVRDDLNAFVEAQAEPEWQEWGRYNWSYPNCPVPAGTDTEVMFRNGSVFRDFEPEDWPWDHNCDPEDITHFRTFGDVK